MFYMRKKLILGFYRVYLKWDKKTGGKPSFVEFLLLVIVAACITFKFKNQIEEKLLEREPAGNQRIYDYTAPAVPLPIHESLRRYKD